MAIFSNHCPTRISFRIILITSFFWAPFSHSNAFAQLLQVNGTKIVNSTTGQEMILNAVNMGNWMVMEGYIMNSESQAPDQHTWKQKLTDLVGSNSVKTFYDAWLTNHVTQADINQIKAWGFNAVRLPCTTNTSSTSEPPMCGMIKASPF